MFNHLQLERKPGRKLGWKLGRKLGWKLPLPSPPLLMLLAPPLLLLLLLLPSSRLLLRQLLLALLLLLQQQQLLLLLLLMLMLLLLLLIMLHPFAVLEVATVNLANALMLQPGAEASQVGTRKWMHLLLVVGERARGSLAAPVDRFTLLIPALARPCCQFCRRLLRMQGLGSRR